MFNKFNEIEKKYPVESIEYQGNKIWTYLRTVYFRETIKDFTNSYSNSKKEKNFFKFIKYIKQSFYGFNNWFRSYEYIFFSDSGSRSKVNNEFIDIHFEKIIHSLGNQKSLYIDLPNPSHYPIQDIPTKNIVSIVGLKIIITSFSKIFSFLNIYQYKNDLLEEINRVEKLNVDYYSYINKAIITTKVYKIIFRFYKPKVIFLVCYYGKESIIKAAKELNIKVVEVQHGMIGRKHFAYHPNKDLDSSYIPDLLLTFGELDKKLITMNSYNPFKKVMALGRYSLELLKQEPIPSELWKIKKRHQILISVSTQYTVEKELAEFISKVAKKNNELGFLVSLRHYDKDFYKQFNLTNNIYLFESKFTCYNLLSISDVHLTCYSTCALEATFFEKIVVLVNINNLAFKYLSDFKNKNIYIIQNENDFNEILSKQYKEDKTTIYADNYEKNISNALKYIGVYK